MNNLYQFKGAALGFKDVDGKQGIVTGYFSAFNNVDSDRDVIRKGAFEKSISENGPASKQPRIKHLFNHSPYQPLGKITELKEDSIGLYYESKIGSHYLGTDFMKMVESDLIKEHSIGYQIVKRNQVGKWEDPSESAVWELTELKLMEGSSLSAWGANPNTPLTGVKGMKVDDLKTRIEKLEKFCRNSSASDECIELLLIEIKQLGQMAADISEKSTVPGSATQPRKGSSDYDPGLILSYIETQKQLFTA